MATKSLPGAGHCVAERQGSDLHAKPDVGQVRVGIFRDRILDAASTAALRVAAERLAAGAPT